MSNTQTIAIALGNSRSRTRFRISFGPALITGATLLGVFTLWQCTALLVHIPESILPSPAAILTQASWATVGGASLSTLYSTLLGFLAGNLFGLVLAVLVCASRTLADTIYPGAVIIRSVPIVALAPFITLAFGRETGATVVVAALIVFFPTLVNTMLGLRAAPVEALELMRVFNAGPVFSYLRMRVPFALPSFASALRISAPNAVLGVMTAEWVIGGQGLGRLIVQSWLSLNIPTMWAAVFVSAAIAWLLFSVLGVLERALLTWAVRT